MKRLKVLLIDDEANNRALLRQMLTQFFPAVDIVGEANDVQVGIAQIRALAPRLVFLDVEMPGGNADALLRAFPHPDFEVVFVTGYDQRDLTRLQAAALEFLEKPVSLEELRALLEGLDIPGQDSGMRLQHLAESGTDPGHLVLPLEKGYRRIAKAELLYLESNGGYTWIHFRDGQSSLAAKSLAHFEALLAQDHFFRIHRSYLIHLHHVSHYEAGRGGQVTLLDRVQLPIAHRRKSAFVKLLRPPS